MNRPDSPELPAWELLLTWVAVVESGSISAAASRQGISQAGASQHVKQLETLYGTPLLDRSTRPARTTAGGQRLYEHAVQLLRQAGDLAESVRHLGRSKRSLVRLGCVDSFAATIGPHLVRALAGSMGKLRLYSGLSPALNRQFAERQLDLLVTTTDLGGDPLVQRWVLLTESYVVVTPAAHALDPAHSLRQLSDRLPLMCYSQRSELGRQADAYLRSTDPGIEHTYEFDATDPLLSLVAAGLGFALTTPLCIWQSRHFVPGIRVSPLSAFRRQAQPYPPLARTFYLTCREGEVGRLAQDVRELVRVAGRQLTRQIADTLALGPRAMTVALARPG